MVRAVARKTKKAAKTQKESGMTVPELRRAFEHVERWTKTHSGDVEGFQAMWKKVFGKEVSKDAAKDYLDFVKAKGGKQSGGGQVMSPAPLGYDLRAGADIPYGSFPKYVSDGFGFANMDSLTAMSGKEDITPKLPADLGSNLVGGARKARLRKTRRAKKQSGGGLPAFSTAVAEFLTRPFGMGSPPSASQDAQMLSKGLNTLPSPRPEINDLEFTPKPTIYNASINPVSRSF
jgi:hypothetical protein